MHTGMICTIYMVLLYTIYTIYTLLVHMICTICMPYCIRSARYIPSNPSVYDLRDLHGPYQCIWSARWFVMCRVGSVWSVWRRSCDIPLPGEICTIQHTTYNTRTHNGKRRVWKRYLWLGRDLRDAWSLPRLVGPRVPRSQYLLGQV